MRIVKFHGSPLTLAGRLLKKYKPAPDFTVSSTDLKDVKLSDFDGKIKIITTFPSIDTPVCDLQVKEFNKRALGFSKDIVVLGISKDLPFAQARFCSLNEIKNVLTLSDYKTSSFGINYGLLIKELNLLARSVLIVDKADIIRYIQVVEETTKAPDYDDVLKNLEEIIKNPGVSGQAPKSAHCKPCEISTPTISKEDGIKLLSGLKDWNLIDDKIISKTIKFKDFLDAKYFADLVSVIAEQEGHHPSIELSWGLVRINLTTHKSKGLTDNDFIIAGIIDELLEA